jgi:hypothetical protein
MADKSAAAYHPYNTLEEAREAEFVRQYLGVWVRDVNDEEERK